MFRVARAVGQCFGAVARLKCDAYVVGLGVGGAS